MLAPCGLLWLMNRQCSGRLGHCLDGNCLGLCGKYRQTILELHDGFCAFPTQATHPMSLLINALAFFFFLYLLVALRDYKRRGGLPYPPGPPSRPIIGNLLDIPKDTPWTVYADMSKKYGTREYSRETCSRKLKFVF